MADFDDLRSDLGEIREEVEILANAILSIALRQTGEQHDTDVAGVLLATARQQARKSREVYGL